MSTACTALVKRLVHMDDWRTCPQRSPALRLYAYRNMLSCMRTTLDINDRLLAEAKRLAASRGVSLKALVEEALRERLHARGGRTSAKLSLPTFSGNGLQPGVDLADGAALLEAMDAEPGR